MSIKTILNKTLVLSPTGGIPPKLIYDLFFPASSMIGRLSKDELRTLQMEIEDQTILFDDESIHKSVSNIIRILIRDNDECAKDYLRGMEL